MDEYFEKIFLFTIGAEGKYTNDSSDPGGETNYGICKRDYPNLDIKNLTIDQVKEIYYKNYWIPANCDKLVSMNFSFTAMVVFDSAINCGTSTARKFIQRVLGVVDDGIIGPMTLGKIMLYKDQDLCIKVIEERKNYYNYIINRNSKLEKFREGWNNRLDNLRRFLKLI